jgi:hypothetical protein
LCVIKLYHNMSLDFYIFAAQLDNGVTTSCFMRGKIIMPNHYTKKYFLTNILLG